MTMPMTDEQLLGRPVGWWLKEADGRLNAAFDRALANSDVSRRGWQVLSSLSKRPASLTDLETVLKSFDSPDTLHGVVAELERHGWVHEEDWLLRLTSDGAQTQTDLTPVVDRVRRQVQNALPPDDYINLIRLLARFTEAL
jgi:hypothetical protein